jgi:hypothetical protein
LKPRIPPRLFFPGRITRWRLLLEEYGSKYVHIAGKNNIVAYALSRLEKDDDENLSETEESLVLSHAMCAVEQDEAICTWMEWKPISI